MDSLLERNDGKISFWVEAERSTCTTARWRIFDRKREQKRNSLDSRNPPMKLYYIRLQNRVLMHFLLTLVVFPRFFVHHGATVSLLRHDGCVAYLAKTLISVAPTSRSSSTISSAKRLGAVTVGFSCWCVTSVLLRVKPKALAVGRCSEQYRDLVVGWFVHTGGRLTWSMFAVLYQKYIFNGEKLLI